MLSILHVEDEAVDREAFARFVYRQGFSYVVDEASSLASAREQLEANRYDVVLADFTLPDGTAVDVIEFASGTPVVVITGATSIDVAVESLRAGAWDYIMKDAAGEYFALIPATIDKVTARSAAEGAARRGADLEFAYRQLDRMLGTVGETLRIPLDSAVHFLRMAQSRCGDDRLLNSFHRSSIAGISRAQALVLGLIDYARCTSISDIREVDGDAILDGVLAAKGALSSRIEIHRAGEIGTVMSDARRLAAVFTKLLDNVEQHAADATRVDIGVRSEEDVVRVTVSDDGPGIPAESLGEARRAFGILGEPRGVGLGLPACETMIERMGGSMRLSSRGGCTVEITLRRAAAPRREGERYADTS